MTMDQQNPPILRPIPRRPFGLNLTSPTPPSEDSHPSTPAPAPVDHLATPQLLSPHVSASGTVSRSHSALNLTSSALFGIFNPLGPNEDPFRDEQEDAPWAGSQTPLRRPDLDDETYNLLRDRSRALKDRLEAGEADPPAARVAFSLVSRTSLLFLLGMSYGALVTRLRGARSLPFGQEEAKDALGWGYLAGWGVSGVAFGALLPWFDGVWEAAFKREGKSTREAKEGPTGTDWSHVVRSIGAFVGIVFALRKLPWVSTLQVSMALALANPFLWYLVDGTKPGLLLSATVGLTGSLVLLGINPDAMPAPSLPPLGGAWSGNASDAGGGTVWGGPGGTSTVETGIWMLSVLFCSCVCFGNVGRRLALSRDAARTAA